MRAFINWLNAVALLLGGPGLFAVAFLDSSFVSLPQINDVLVVLMVTEHKSRMVYYALMTTLGSISGCLALYTVARKGGEAFLRRRFKEGHVTRAMTTFRKYGLLAILIPSILPPPMPFKIFVLAAGVSKVKLPHFIAAIAIGRGTRYFGEGLLAVFYGDAAAEYLKTNARPIAMVFAALCLVGGVGYVLWRRRREGRRTMA